MRGRTTGTIEATRRGEDALTAALRRIPLEHFVLWTGEPFKGQPDSRMGRLLACMAEPGVPVQLRELVLRTAGSGREQAVDPCAVKAAVRQHQMSTRVVLVLVERRSDGEFQAVTDIPYGVGTLRRILAGDLVRRAAVAAPCA